MKSLIVLLMLFCYAVPSAASGTQTPSQEEVRRFLEVRNRIVFAEKPEEHWDVILTLEKLLADFPNTFLQGDATRLLFKSYSKVVNDPGFLLRLAEKTMAHQTPTSGLYEEIGRVFVEKKIFPDRALGYAGKALELAEQTHAVSGNYKRQIIRKRRLLSKAYQLANHPGKALEEMKQSLQEMEDWSPKIADLASRKQAIDEIKLDLLKLYAEQEQWEPGYILACDLLVTSLKRDGVSDLWSTCYVGKFGSAEGIGDAYANLKSEQERERKTRLVAERIKRPAPAFALRTVEDDTLSLEVLRGRVLLVTFWAGWCGPCLKELPQLEQLKQTFKNQPVEFLTVNMDQSSVEARKRTILGQIATSAPSLTYLLGDEETQKAFGVVALPYNCIIDQEGNIRYEQSGLKLDFKATLEDQLTWLLSEER